MEGREGRDHPYRLRWDVMFLRRDMVTAVQGVQRLRVGAFDSGESRTLL